MPADRKCWDDVEVRSADDVQRTVDASRHQRLCSSAYGALQNVYDYDYDAAV